MGPTKCIDSNLPAQEPADRVLRDIACWGQLKLCRQNRLLPPVLITENGGLQENHDLYGNLSLPGFVVHSSRIEYAI